jgi:hypothetical protein
MICFDEDVGCLTQRIAFKLLLVNSCYLIQAVCKDISWMTDW